MSNSVIPTQCQAKRGGLINGTATICDVVRTNSLDTCGNSVLVVNKPLQTDTVTLKQLDTAPPSPPAGHAVLWIDLAGDVQVKLPSI